MIYSPQWPSRRPLGRSGHHVAEALDQAADLSSRYLTDRAGLSASAEYLLDRVSRQGLTRLTGLAREAGTSQPAMTQRIRRLPLQGPGTQLPDPDHRRVAPFSLPRARP